MDAITQAYRALGKFALEIEPARIGAQDFEPTREDGSQIIFEMFLFAELVDNVIEARGAYLMSRGIVRDHSFRTYFKHQLRGALEGNAFYEIESGIDERIEARREAAE